MNEKMNQAWIIVTFYTITVINNDFNAFFFLEEKAHGGKSAYRPQKS